VTEFRPGDEVFAYCRRHHLQFGTYGELTSVPDAFVAHKPRSLSWEEAAALPLAGLTAFQTLETLGVRAGEKLLVTGGGGGVGHLAIALGAIRGAHVIATASPENHDFLRELGADPLDYHDEDLPARVREITGDGGADAALDLFGGDGREQAFASLRSGGRLASIAAPPPEPRDGYEAHYVFVRPSGVDLRELADLADEGQLKPHVEEVFPLERAADAHERIEGGHVRGKLVLSVSAG
jgi:NADPH:quinone reductase-like Zn-dependent oxidoreductase